MSIDLPQEPAELRRLEAEIRRDIPITQHLQFHVAGCDGRGLRLRAPLAPNINHKDTAFGGSLSMLAMIAGWGMMRLLVPKEASATQIVIQHCEVSFLRPVHQDFEVVCSPPGSGAYERFCQLFERRGKARLHLEGSIREAGRRAVTFEGAYVAVRG